MTHGTNFNIEEIRKAIKSAYGWGSTQEWTSFHYNALKVEIEKLTGYLLSVETLKRVFEKPKAGSTNRQPQAYNRNALIRFVHELKGKSQSPISKLQAIQPVIKSSRKKLIIFSLSFIFIISSIIALSVGYSDRNPTFSSPDLVFVCPDTVHFKYNIRGEKDSVFTNFGCDNETYLPKNESETAYYYSDQGEFKVLFYTREKILASLLVISKNDSIQ